MNPFLPQAAKLELVHPVDGPTGCFLTLVGLESKQAQAQARRSTLDSKSLADIARQNVDAATMQKINDEQTRVIAACVVGWDAKFEEHFGPWTAERGLEVFTMPEMTWATEQVVEFIKDRRNFFRSAAGGPRGVDSLAGAREPAGAGNEG